MNGNVATKKPRGQQRSRRNRSGKKTPFRASAQSRAGDNFGNNAASPSAVADMMRQGEEAKSGQFAEALANRNKPVKRERLHKLLAQSGHGSRRDMEILIASGRVMINGSVATAGAHVSEGDKVLIDHRLVPIKFTPDLPRVLLYHKPEGEIVSNADPGNRISVFDNLPRVENAKWIAIGRLDFNTSGLLIFTTSGELANRMMHPRFEVEREYAVRILGELTDEQMQRLQDGINIDADPDDDDDDDVFEEDDGGDVVREHRPARFTFIEKRAGPDPDKTSANNWYHVVIKEGRNREVRRMFEALGLTVSRLMRVRFGKVELPPQLKRGGMHELDPGQIKDLLIWAGVPTEGMDFNAPRPQQRPGKRGAKPNRPAKVRSPDNRQQRGRQQGNEAVPMDGQPPAQGEAGQPGNSRRKSRGRKGPRQQGAGGAGDAAAGNATTGNATPGNAKARTRRGRKAGQGVQGQGQRQGQGQGQGLPGQGKSAGNRRNKKGRKGAGRVAEAREPRSLRAEPMVAWTGQPITGSGRRGEGKPARQPRIIRTVTRRPRLPENEGES